jgi:hypothetical protein
MSEWNPYIKTKSLFYFNSDCIHFVHLKCNTKVLKQDKLKKLFVRKQKQLNYKLNTTFFSFPKQEFDEVKQLEDLKHSFGKLLSSYFFVLLAIDCYTECNNGLCDWLNFNTVHKMTG